MAKLTSHPVIKQINYTTHRANSCFGDTKKASPTGRSCLSDTPRCRPPSMQYVMPVDVSVTRRSSTTSWEGWKVVDVTQTPCSFLRRCMRWCRRIESTMGKNLEEMKVQSSVSSHTTGRTCTGSIWKRVWRKRPRYQYLRVGCRASRCPHSHVLRGLWTVISPRHSTGDKLLGYFAGSGTQQIKSNNC